MNRVKDVLIITIFAIIIALNIISLETKEPKITYATKYNYKTNDTVKIVGKITQINNDCITLQNNIDCYITNTERIKDLQTDDGIIIKGTVKEVNERITLINCSIR